MLRKVSCGLAAAVVAILLSSPSQAGVVSKDNPYRSFNSGVNYGAQQWEHAHHTHQHGHILHLRRG